MQDKTLDHYMNLSYAGKVQHTEYGYSTKVVKLPGCVTSADYALLLSLISTTGCHYLHAHPDDSSAMHLGL